jgi:hypothetical protein
MSKKPVIDLNNIVLKPDWMRPPAWRWAVAQSFLADPMKPIVLAQKDKYLGDAVGFYKARKQYVQDPVAYAKKYPDIATAFELYCDSRPSGWRWYIEALLMTGISCEDLQKVLKVNCPVSALEMFRKLFFDIEEYKNSEIAVYANVLSTSRTVISDFSNYDYTWKIFAYCWGAEDFIKQFCFKSREPNKEHREWFKEFTMNNMTVGSFHLTNDLRMTYNMQAMEIIKTAQQYWSIPKSAIDDGEKMVKDDVMGELLGHIDMQLMKADMKIDALEGKHKADYVKFSFT